MTQPDGQDDDVDIDELEAVADGVVDLMRNWYHTEPYRRVVEMNDRRTGASPIGLFDPCGDSVVLYYDGHEPWRDDTPDDHLTEDLRSIFGPRFHVYAVGPMLSGTFWPYGDRYITIRVTTPDDVDGSAYTLGRRAPTHDVDGSASTLGRRTPTDDATDYGQ